MAAGHVTAVLGAGPAYTQAHVWVAGPPRSGGVGGNRGAEAAGREHYALAARRCAACGFVELYAGA